MTKTEDRFKVGDKVTPVKRIEFCDDSTHEVGQSYTVTEDTWAYFNVCQKDYKGVK